MFKQFLSAITVLLIATCVVHAQAKERVYGGVGYAASATTTPQEFVFEQAPGDQLITNGTFASDAYWTKGANWSIAGGSASYTNYTVLIGGTNTTGVISQASIDLTTNVAYRLTYTVSGITNGSAQTFTPYLGNNPLTTRTVDGTYTEDIKLFGAMTLAFYVTSTNAVTNNLDDVWLYEKPNAGWVDVLNLSGASTMTPVHFLFNCDGNDLTNAYNLGRTMQITSNNVPLHLDFGGQKTPIYKMWYRSASGTESFIINAR